jgi:hypothetical protein
MIMTWSLPADADSVHEAVARGRRTLWLWHWDRPAAPGLVPGECGTRVMNNKEPDGTEGPVERHVREILAQISALATRLRAQEQAVQNRSDDAAEHEREEDGASGVHDAHPPA